MSDVTRILESIEQGDPKAADKLLPLVYEELRKLAASRMASEKPNQLRDYLSITGTARIVEGGAPQLLKRLAKVMLGSGRGSIINIASVAGFVSLSERYPMAAYVASKTGIVGLTRELGAQWAARGIRVNAIAPGWFPSRMTGHLRDADLKRWIEQRTPIGRPGLPNELDGALVFLASDASSYVVGQTIAVDGGWTTW